MAEKVLVVDDERQIRDLLGEFLEREGYEVFLASAGEEAIELAERKIPHAILLDVKMPGIDGIEVCKRLKAEPLLTLPFGTPILPADRKQTSQSTGQIVIKLLAPDVDEHLVAGKVWTHPPHQNAL